MRQYLYCGIVVCLFECCFQFVDFVEVGNVMFENGFFSIEFKCVVLEVMKFCCIEIGGGKFVVNWIEGV